ncbi:Uncharacterised protein [uncultured archaeon]|nr:Uncharacterised protein [uncultured archaeon]
MSTAITATLSRLLSFLDFTTNRSVADWRAILIFSTLSVVTRPTKNDRPLLFIAEKLTSKSAMPSMIAETSFRFFCSPSISASLSLISASLVASFELTFEDSERSSSVDSMCSRLGTGLGFKADSTARIFPSCSVKSPYDSGGFSSDSLASSYLLSWMAPIS